MRRGARMPRRSAWRRCAKRREDQLVELAVVAGDVTGPPRRRRGAWAARWPGSSTGNGCVGAELGLGALDAGAAAGPGLALGIARAHEQRELLGASGRDHRQRVGLGEAGEVPEVARLAEAMLDVGVAHRELLAADDGDGARSDALHQLLPSRGIHAHGASSLRLMLYTALPVATARSGWDGCQQRTSTTPTRLPTRTMRASAHKGSGAPGAR